MFQHVLVPLDGSERAEVALAHALTLVDIDASRMTLVRIVERGSEVVDPLDWHLRRAEAEAYLKRLAESVEGERPVDTAVLEGRPAEQILAHAHEVRADLIVLSSHGSSGMQTGLGAVAQKVSLGAGCSVALIRRAPAREQAKPAGRYRRIMLPLDGSTRAECALPVAAAIARSHDATLLVVHVLRRPELMSRTPPSEEDRHLADRLLERNRAEADRYLHGLVGGDDTAELRLVVGDSVVDAVEAVVEQEQVDLLVTAAHGQSGTERFAYGSVAASLLVLGSAPLLIVQDQPSEFRIARAEGALRRPEARPEANQR